MTAAIIEWVTEPLSYSFMQRALLAAVLVGILSPLVGTWVVLGRLSYLGDAMGHATLAGVALAYLAGLSIVAGALVAGLTMALLMALLARHPRLRSDSIIGIVQVTLFALGVVVISRSTSISVDISHFLFGSIATVTEADLRLNAVLTIVAVVALAVVFSDLRAASFDPLHASLTGVPVGALRLLLFAALAVAVVVSLQSVGLLMSIAMLVIPAATARLWTQTMLSMSILACALGVTSAVLGLLLSYQLASSPGATIALTTVAVLVVSALLTGRRRGRAPSAHGVQV